MCSMERRRFSAEPFLYFSQTDEHKKGDICAPLAPAPQRPERIDRKSLSSPSNPSDAITSDYAHVVNVEQNCVLWQTTAPDELSRLNVDSPAEPACRLTH